MPLQGRQPILQRSESCTFEGVGILNAAGYLPNRQQGGSMQVEGPATIGWEVAELHLYTRVNTIVAGGEGK